MLPVAETICLFGDGHLAALRQALADGTVLPGYAAEFWGASGAGFRQLIQGRDGRIAPVGEAAAMVAAVNGRGRASLGPQDFDLFLFWGARLRVDQYLVPFLHRRQSGITDSFAVLAAAAAQFLVNARGYRFARDFARAGAEVWLVPAPYRIAGRAPDRDPDARAADRTYLWSVLESVAAQDGLRLIRQPEDTVTGGALTQPRFAADDHSDLTSPAYAARLLAAFLKRRPARDMASYPMRGPVTGTPPLPLSPPFLPVSGLARPEKAA